VGIYSHLFVCWIDYFLCNKDLFSLNGKLEPAKEDVPGDPCVPYRHGEPEFIFGGGNGSVGVLESDFDSHVIILKYKSRSDGDDIFLSADLKPSGDFVINAKVLDDEGKSVMLIDQNQFLINQNEIFNSLSAPRPDKSTILIKDNKGNQLKIRLLNRNTVLFQGKLFYKGNHFVEFGEDGVYLGPPRELIMSHTCVQSGGFGGAILAPYEP